MNSMPAASDIRASARLSSQLPVQRSGTRVTARPDEQFEPNRPIFSALSLYMPMRSRMEMRGAAATSGLTFIGSPIRVDYRLTARGDEALRGAHGGQELVGLLAELGAFRRQSLRRRQHAAG